MSPLTYPRRVDQIVFIWGGISSTPPGRYNCIYIIVLDVVCCLKRVSQGGMDQMGKIAPWRTQRDGFPMVQRRASRAVDSESIVFPWREVKLSRFMTGFILLKNVMKGLSYCK